MKKFIYYVFCSLLVFAFFLGGCSNAETTNPAENAFAYLNALAEKDKTAVINLSCKSWEEQAALEVDALLSVGANLQDVACESEGSEGDYQLVKCSGNLDLTYNDEVRSINLATRIYSMAMEDGQWRVCSYK